MAAKVYQALVEAPTSDDASAKVYQAYAETPSLDAATAKVYQAYAETPSLDAATAKVYQAYAEVPTFNVTNANVYMVYVEMLQSVYVYASVDGVGANGVVGVLPMAAGKVGLRWSDDGGHTWSDYYERSLGDTGAYGTRVVWRRLGMTMKLRDRVYEISGTDATKIIIMGAELQISPTNA